MTKKFLATTFTLAGTIIGAGILGLPYVFANAGYFVGIFWLLVLGAIIIYVNLCLAEVTLRTKGFHQLAGYASKYLGKWGKTAIYFSMIFGIYSALIAYLIGEGESFSILFSRGSPLLFGILFWFFMTMLLRRGLRGLKNVETYGVFAIIILILISLIIYFPMINYNNFFGYNFSRILFPMGAVLFSLLGFVAIPELRVEIKGEERKLKKAVIYGVVIPIVIYIIFSFIFVGIFGKNASEVATVSLGPMAVIFGIFTMMTSFFVLSFSLFDMFRLDMKLSKFNSFVFTSLVPLVIYVLLFFFEMGSFIKVISLGGVISGGVTAVTALLMVREAKKKSKLRSYINVPINDIIIISLSLIFFIGTVQVIYLLFKINF